MDFVFYQIKFQAFQSSLSIIFIELNLICLALKTTKNDINDKLIELNGKNSIPNHNKNEKSIFTHFKYT